MGFTVNISTLFALVLAIGIVVDDAIVVVEGAAHNIEQGMSGHDAAIRAMDQLFGPIIGITLVLMAVFIPAAFLPGLTGRMYAQFALVIAATALLSAVNAATLKPTQCALWLRRPVPPEQRNIIYRGFNRVYDRAERGYVSLIRRIVGAQRRMGRSGAHSYRVDRLHVHADADRLPADRGPGLPDRRACNCPTASSLERTQKALDRVQQIARKTPGVEQVVTIAGISVLDGSSSLSSAGVAYIILNDWEKRGRGQDLLSLFTGLNQSLDVIEDARIDGVAAAADPGRRQCRRRDHAGRSCATAPSISPSCRTSSRRWSQTRKRSRACNA